MTVSQTVSSLDDIDMTPMVVHVQVGNTMFSYCGYTHVTSDWVPPGEVTATSWCPDCVRIQDGTA
jgi:hypothetical protein